MKSEMKQYTIGEIASISAGGDKPSVCSNKCSADTPVPIFSNGLENDGLYGYTNKSKIEGDTVTISARGVNVGTVCYRSEPFLPIVRLLSLIPNRQLVNARYLYYLLKNTHLSGTGSAQPQITVPMIAKQEIFIHDSKETQIKIAKVLSSLDEKIALNIAINENLEQQAQALFKSWFVDFEPFGGVMPDDWRIANLLDIANYLNGLAMQKFRPKECEVGLPVLKIKELRQGFCDDNSELCSPNIKSDFIIQNGDVIFSWSGSLLVDFWCGGKCGLNQHLFKVTSNTFDKWFYYVWTKYHLNRFIAIAADMATTMGHIKRAELEKSMVFIPNKDDYKEIGNLLKPLYDAIINNRVENQRLAALRDTLLPKLMSGEIDVSQVKI